jgi:hypothetical protein
VLWVDKWVYPGWVELVTPGVATGWLREEKFQVLCAAGFEVAPLILTAFVNPAPKWVKLYESPEDLAESGYVTRVRLHASDSTYQKEDGPCWIKAYGNAGWIPLGERTINMRVVPDVGISGLSPLGRIMNEEP